MFLLITYLYQYYRLYLSVNIFFEIFASIILCNITILLCNIYRQYYCALF